MSVVQIAVINHNRLTINLECLRPILDKVGSLPVAVISVNGPMRSGKSYIINHFLRYLTSASANENWFIKSLPTQFHWKSSSDRQTTGILVWSEPLIVKNGGREVAVLLIDTQGCFDDKTTSIENSLIFAFSCLLSSVLIYNFKNQLSEDILQFLQMFLGYAKMVTDQDETAEAFSQLIFLIRDWQCPMDFPFGYYDDHHCPSGKNFKTEKLNVNPTMAPEVRTVHNEIISSFRNVACCLMPYPGGELAYYDKSENADVLFTKAIQDFVPRIFSDPNGIIKTIGGQEITGHQLKQLVEKWAELFSNTEVPAVQNVAEATAEVQNAMALSVALKFYQEEMKVILSSDGLEYEAVVQKHSSSQSEAVSMFQRIKKLKHEAVEKRYLGLLNDDIEREFEWVNEINSTKRKFKEMNIANENEKKLMQEEMKRKIADIQRNNRRRRGGRCVVM